MKIALVIDDTLDSTDGVQQIVLEIGRYLTRVGHEVHYLTSTTERTDVPRRSEEHTSELQSRGHLVCRLLLEKKKKNNDKKQDAVCKVYEQEQIRMEKNASNKNT